MIHKCLKMAHLGVGHESSNKLAFHARNWEATMFVVVSQLQLCIDTHTHTTEKNV